MLGAQKNSNDHANAHGNSFHLDFKRSTWLSENLFFRTGEVNLNVKISSSYCKRGLRYRVTTEKIRIEEENNA